MDADGKKKRYLTSDQVMDRAKKSQAGADLGTSPRPYLFPCQRMSEALRYIIIKVTLSPLSLHQEQRAEYCGSTPPRASASHATPRYGSKRAAIFTRQPGERR